MAKAKTTEAPELTFEISESPGVPRKQKESKPNPLFEAVKHSLDNDKPLQVAATDEKTAKYMEGLVRRAGRDLETETGKGVSTSAKWDGKAVHFKAKYGKSERKYTVQDVRDWAAEQGLEVGPGRVPAEVRKAYRVAHGHDKADDNSDGE